jgi:predicted transcriptional regulator
VSDSTLSYRERSYIIKDIILKLTEYGQLNRTELIRFCGLNLKKHRCILDELQVNGLICVIESSVGKRRISTYKPTQKGMEFYRTILEPYEKMFPRRGQCIIITNSDNIDNKSGDYKEELSVIQMRKSLIESHLMMQ